MLYGLCYVLQINLGQIPQLTRAQATLSSIPLRSIMLVCWPGFYILSILKQHILCCVNMH